MSTNSDSRPVIGQLSRIPCSHWLIMRQCSSLEQSLAAHRVSRGHSKMDGSSQNYVVNLILWHRLLLVFPWPPHGWVSIANYVTDETHNSHGCKCAIFFRFIFNLQDNFQDNDHFEFSFNSYLTFIANLLSKFQLNP